MTDAAPAHSYDPVSAAGVVDHVSVGVGDIAAGKAFYDRALAPLNIVPVVVEANVGVGYGRPRGWPIFWIQPPVNGQAPAPGNGVHVCFGSASRGEVDAFYTAALEAGAQDEGSPGMRREYHPHYYAAFVRDPWGNKIEAVNHGL